MSTYTETSFKPQETTRRRQNRSCDQCRLSKRACDASRQSQTRTNGEQSEFHTPCTYCVKTNKKCTMVKTDLHSLVARSLNRRKQASGSSSGHHSGQGASATTMAFEPSPQSGSQDDLQEWPWMGWNEIQFSTGVEEINQAPSDDARNEGMMMYTGQLPTGDLDMTFPFDAGMQNPLDESCAAVYLDNTDFTGSDEYATEGSQASDKPVLFTAGSDSLSNLSNLDTRTPSRRRGSSFVGSQSGLSPFSIDQRVSTSFHRQMTSSNLLKIYHDVLEHHLSCWVAETTCPYQQSPQNADLVQIATPEWSASWTNRILQRTIRLDHVAQKCNLLYLNPAERKAASNALNLAVSAFATQWAQGSVRARRKYSAPSQESGAMLNMMEDFDRTLQHYFWSQAHRALQDVAELDCYQVACAELIFSLAQRPWQPETPGRGPGYETPSAESVRSQVQSIIERDGPPVYSERAARRMHTLKFRCDSYNKGLGLKGKNLNHGIASMAREDRDTIGLLYWLAIMFDTVAASMYERPVVVTDEECRYEVQRDVVPLCNGNLPYRWDYEIFLQTSGEVTHRTCWPCSYDRAAEDVTRSAPVKVLLFRHVSYLQNALRKSATPHQLEDIIFNTMLIYDYWNRTHGMFFKEMVQDFPNVPQRIRGWFICISAHWHLAVLMLADLLEFIDGNSLGHEAAKHERLALCMIARLREDSSRELSDLGHVATLPTFLSTPREDSPDFHHAVTEGTILTEPWTMILIRAFSQASVFFLERVKVLCDFRDSMGFSYELKKSLREAENCIKALWLLGKKSDMAWDLAETLQEALRGLQNGFVRHIM